MKFKFGYLLWGDEKAMNKQEIDNLDEIIRLSYTHICIHPGDFRQFLNIPEQEKKFYEIKDRSAYDKKGFFNGGKTMVWTSYIIKPLHVKIAGKKVPTSGDGDMWSDEFSFAEEGSVLKIYRTMKLKMFW
jgi:hypothetical protein